MDYIEINEENLDGFFRTMFERQEIWYKRNILKQPHPWTQDKIFSEYRFCNVYRELDRNSQWCINNIIRTNEDIKTKTFQIIAFRLFNVIEMFENLILPDFYGYDAQEYSEVMQMYQDKGGKIRNPEAYNVNTWIAGGVSEGMACATKILPSAYEVVDSLTNADFQDVNRLINKFKTILGIGAFLSHEFFLDITYLSDYSTEKIGFDRNSYTSIGPGATGGLKTIFGDKLPMNKMKCLKEIYELTEFYLSSIGAFKYIKWNKDTERYERSGFNLNITTVEFWLCEWFKYYKISQGKTWKRKKFNPTP